MDDSYKELEELLQVREQPIADDGFSEAVLTCLPAKGLRERTARCLSYVIAGGIGSVLTLLLVSPEFRPFESLTAILPGYSATASSLLISVAVIALFMAPVAWLVYGETADAGSE